MVDKAIDAMDDKHQARDLKQTPEKERQAKRVQELFRAAYNAKLQLKLHDTWTKCDDYKHSRQNPPQTETDPGSVTNIIHPIIESMIADLIDKPYSVGAKGKEPSDELYSDQVKHLLEFALEKNQFKLKQNTSEHDRLELGTTIAKVWFDSDELDGKGLPKFEIISPENFFPDPKVTTAHDLQEGEFVIHAVPRPLSWIRKRFPELGKYVVREVSVPYDPEIFTEDESDEISCITSEKALLLECYQKDDNGEIYSLHVANNIVLEDSLEVLKGKRLQRQNRYPFVMIPCFIQRGHPWGQSVVELLIPTQDIINELDDQERLIHRLMGNPQIVVGMGAGKGFNHRKWTNATGLRIPMRDHNAFTVVPAASPTSALIQRREKGFEEANIVSGRPDVNRGERPGQITAASAIISLQQAGQKIPNHMAEMYKESWKEVLDLLYDEILYNWEDEMWVRINGEKPDYKFYDPSKIKNVPMLIPNAAAGPDEDTLTQLLDDSGAVMTRDAQYDFNLSMGNGLPNDKAFIYTTLVELSKVAIAGKPLISWKELREYLRDEVGMPLMDDDTVTAELQPPTPISLPPGALGVHPEGGMPQTEPEAINQQMAAMRGGLGG